METTPTTEIKKQTKQRNTKPKLTYDPNQAKPFNINHKKETGLARGFKVLDLIRKNKTDHLNTIMDARLYYAGNTAYCCIWIYLPDNTTLTASAKAGGYGYDKQKASFDTAIWNLGFRNAESAYEFSGYEKAISSIMKYFKIKKFETVEYWA
jgi:ADP-glucose pyrophosphorylase